MAVAVMKKKTRRKLSKQMNKLIKLHGAEMALALVTGIVSALAAERKNKTDKKKNKTDKKQKSAKSGKAAKPEKAARAETPARAEKAAKPPAMAAVVRKRA
jgi:hypothetical protein